MVADRAVIGVFHGIVYAVEGVEHEDERDAVEVCCRAPARRRRQHSHIRVACTVTGTMSRSRSRSLHPKRFGGDGAWDAGTIEAINLLLNSE